MQQMDTALTTPATSEEAARCDRQRLVGVRPSFADDTSGYERRQFG